MHKDRIIDWAAFRSIEEKLIAEEIGENIIRPEGSYILVRIYETEEFRNAEKVDENFLKINGIFVSREHKELKTFEYRCGRVLAFGPRAFHGSYFHPSEPRFKHGDWVQFERYRIAHSPINGIPLGYIQDIAILGTVKDPDKLDKSPQIGK